MPERAATGRGGEAFTKWRSACVADVDPRARWTSTEALKAAAENKETDAVSHLVCARAGVRGEEEARTAVRRARTTTRMNTVGANYFSASQPPRARAASPSCRGLRACRAGCCARAWRRPARATREGGGRGGRGVPGDGRAARREWCAQRQGSGRGGGRGWDGRLVR